jgi:3-methyladenine DNA glycosylase AlkD
VTLSKPEVADLVRETVSEITRPRRIGVPAARQIRKRLSARVKSESAAEVISIGLALSRAPALKVARARWVGWELINKHRPALESLEIATVEALGAGNSSWDEVDGFGIYIFGAAWLRGLIRDADIRRWAKDPDLWRRRAALVATVVLNLKAHGGHGDTRRTLDIAGRLIDDREDMVVKAMSWALRALVPWDRTAVEAFLREHDDRLAARIKRETRTKLATGRKNPKKSTRPSTSRETRAGRDGRGARAPRGHR